MSEMVRLAPLFEADGELNLISEIFRKLGTPSEEIMNFYNDSQLKISTKICAAEQPLNCYIDGMNSLGVDLISKMLKFSPFERISALNSVEHAYFGVKEE